MYFNINVKLSSGKTLKLVSAIFCQLFISYQSIALQKLWKMFFVSSKKLFSFSRYAIFCISAFPFFLSVSHCFRGWSKINLKVCDIINCLNKNSITQLVDPSDVTTSTRNDHKRQCICQIRHEKMRGIHPVFQICLFYTS